VDFGFNGNTKEEFLSFFGEKHLWFWKIVEAVRKAKVELGLTVTDVLVRKDAVFLGVLKNFFDVFEKVYGEELSVEADLIKDFVETFCRKVGIFAKSKSFDFAINCYGYGVFRINSSESASSPILNVRVLDFRIPDLKDLKCPPYYLSFLENELLKEESLSLKELSGEISEVSFCRINRGGLILHAGETGSGKTTFIASELQFLADRISGLIVTYEKPVEYRFVGPYSLRVIQYDLDLHLDDKDVYRHFLRNSPHVGFFYEIRDREDFVKVVDLAGRGHLVFSTVHASDVYEVFSLFGLFDEKVKQMFLSSLRAIVCHKLILDKDKGVVPLYEIFVNSESSGPVASLFMKNEFVKLKTFLYKEKGYEKFYSFTDYERFLVVHQQQAFKRRR